jgi:trk system potassium uptake protein TrkH
MRDTQVRGLLTIVLITTLFLTVSLLKKQHMPLLDAITHSCFNLVSVITTTGFASTDYQQWGNLTWIVFLFCTFVGGCSGSTSGGIKVFRLQLFFGLIKEQLVTAIHPKAVISRRYNNRIVSPEIIASSVSFMIFMFLSLLIITLILGMTGLDLITSVSGAATALMNVGPGLGDVIGPAGNFSSLSDPAKYTLAFGMLLGRLEFVTLLVLFSPAFWRA